MRHGSGLYALIISLLVTDPVIAADAAASYSAGDLRFSHATFPTTSDTIMNAFPADLDGDGDLDVVIGAGTWPSEGGSSRGPQEGLILFNNGDNTFTPAEGDAPGSESPRDLLARDFNGDGILDLYIADHGYDAPPYPGFRDQLMLGTGSGFVDATDRLPNIAAFTHNAAAGDIDGDGDSDIFAMNSDAIESEFSYLLLNDGDANFTLNRSLLPASLTSLDVLTNSYAAELADLNGDGRAELIIGRRDHTNQTPTRIHWNDGQGQFSDSDVTFLDEIDVFNDFEALQVIGIMGRDFDGDGRNDLLVNAYKTDFTGTSLQLFINRGNRVFANETLRLLGDAAVDPSPAADVPYFFTVLDVNGDGIQDLLPNFSRGTEDNKPFLFEGSGNACFNTVTMADVAPDAPVGSDLRRELGQFPLYSAGEFGYGSFGSLESNGQRIIYLNYVPVTVTERPMAANYLHDCSGKLKVTLSAEGIGIYSADFSIVATEPTVLLQLDLASLRERVEAPDRVAVFDAEAGSLTLPEIEVAGAVVLRNVVLRMSDPETLQFALESFEEP